MMTEDHLERILADVENDRKLNIIITPCLYDHLNTIESLVAEVRAARERQKELIAGLIFAALPLEAIHASVKWELCDEIKSQVADAVKRIRELAAKEPK